jgi:tetratricopeptide (TPR) repeat protein
MNVTLMFLEFVALVLNLNGISYGITDVAAFSRMLSSGKLVSKSKPYSPYQWRVHTRCKILAISAATSSENQNRMLARQYIQEGMELFRNGDVAKSIEYFDSAEQNDRSITPYLWQRGLSYYYNQQYEKASQQFRVDVSVNPYDVEEIVWDIASQLQLIRMQQPDQKTDAMFPISNQLSLPPGSKDRRRIMVSYIKA